MRQSALGAIIRPHGAFSPIGRDDQDERVVRQAGLRVGFAGVVDPGAHAGGNGELPHHHGEEGSSAQRRLYPI